MVMIRAYMFLYKSLTAWRDGDISPPHSEVINVLLQGVINVLVYEAPQELVVNNILKAMIYILCLYNN